MRHTVSKVVNREPVSTEIVEGAGLSIALDIADREFGPGYMGIWSKNPGRIVIAPYMKREPGHIAPPAPDCRELFWIVEAIQ